jgi:uncharacterized protein (TIGR02996 family)
MDEALRRFREQIIASPDEVTLRRVYADRLVERGDPRGLFIQVQCELADSWLSAERRAELLDIEAKLLHRNYANWIRPAKVESPSHGVFVRGFLERWTCWAADFIARGNRVTKSTPLAELRLRQPRASQLAHLSRLRGFLGLRRLALEGMTDWGSASLRACEFTRLEHLRVQGKPRLEAGLFDLAFIGLSETRWFSRLTSLEIDLPMSPAFAAALSSSRAMLSLKRLVLLGGITRTVWPGGPAPALEELEMDLFDDPSGLRALLEAAPRLRALTIRAGLAVSYVRARRATPPAVLLEVLRNIPRRVTSLTLWHAVVDEASTAVLLGSGLLDLRLTQCRIAERDLDRLRVRFPELAQRGTHLVNVFDRARAWLAER